MNRGIILSSLTALLEEILHDNGYDTTRQGEYILAQKDEVKAAVCPQVIFNLPAFKRFLAEFKEFSGKKILVALEGLSEETAYEVDAEIIIWDQESLENELKRLRVEALVGGSHSSIVDELTATDFPPLVSAALLDDVENASLGDLILRINVTEKELAAEYPHCTAKALQLVPYYVFNYTLKTSTPAAKNILAVNAISLSPEKWEELDVIYTLEKEHTKLQPAIKVEDAEEIALAAVIEAHSCIKEYIYEDRQTTLTERRKIVPQKEEIELEYLNLYYVPMWYLKNAADEICLNAHNLKIADFCRSPVDRSAVQL